MEGTAPRTFQVVKDELVMNILKEFEEKCATDLNKLKQIGDAMCVEMHAGLASEGGSELNMLISYVDKLPTGIIDCSAFMDLMEMPLCISISV
ncbi:hexokinase-1-like protein isoform X2 [Tanacetum coccineum]